jgi:hypothetical protein
MMIGGNHMNEYKRSIQKDLLQFGKDEPIKACILWHFKLGTDTAQAASIPAESNIKTGVGL